MQIFASAISMQRLYTNTVIASAISILWLNANICDCNINAEVVSCIQIFSSVLLYHGRG